MALVTEGDVNLSLVFKEIIPVPYEGLRELVHFKFDKLTYAAESTFIGTQTIY